MLFSDEFIASIADDPVTAVVKLVDLVDSQLDVEGHEWTQSEYDALFAGFALLQSVVVSFSLPQLGAFPQLTGRFVDDAMLMRETLNQYQKKYQVEVTEMRAQSMISHFNTLLGSQFSYEFSQGDLERVQLLVNELRDNIGACGEIEPEHKQRLLRRLEKLQSELHKKMSDLDRFWGLVGDAGVILGKLGNDSKPFVDRIKEIADIVWRTQSRAEELPSNTPTPLESGENRA